MKNALQGGVCKNDRILEFFLLCVEINISPRTFIGKVRTWLLCSLDDLGFVVIHRK